MDNKELWRVHKRKEGKLRVSGVWFHDWREFESVVDWDKHVSEYGVFDSSDKEIGEDGIAGYGQTDSNNKENKWNRSLEVYL